ncbi:MAG: class I SAM-dependent methyltransferase [Alphaproteobacteria bacterium]|nr:class I SAM-dependent methyltransferase [Alphaproteobacteria bacterium]MBU0859646.1 class I SAM-dependent methyltransferase [Alphaproteobacteria bacterium]
MADQSDFSTANAAGYDLWAQFYDAYPNPTVAIDDLSFPALWAHVQNSSVIEIGCGTGRHTVRLAEAGNDVTGLDISAGMLEKARTKIPGNNVRLIHADFMSYDDISPAQFDMAIASLVIEHIADLHAFFTRLARVLRQGGDFYMSEIHPARTAEGVFAHFRDPHSGQDVHLQGRPHTTNEIESAAQMAGFSVMGRHDGKGHADLTALNPKWEKYEGKPLIQMWRLRRGTR